MSDVVFKEFYDIVEGVDEAIDDGLLIYAENVVGQAKVLAPVITGRLRNAVMYKAKDQEFGLNIEQGAAASPVTVPANKGQVIVGANTKYAASIEFGNRTREAKPFLRPAIDEVFKSDAVKRSVAKAQEAAFKKAKK